MRSLVFDYYDKKFRAEIQELGQEVHMRQKKKLDWLKPLGPSRLQEESYVFIAFYNLIVHINKC